MQVANRSFKEFEPVAYSKQVVAGMNYEIEYDIGDGEKMRVKVFEPLPYTNDLPQVSSVKIIPAP